MVWAMWGGRWGGEEHLHLYPSAPVRVWSVGEVDMADMEEIY